MPELSGKSSARPRLRPVEVFPTEEDEQLRVVVHDPSGLAAGPMVVSQAGLLILSLLDGRNTIAEIGKLFAAQAGQELPHERLAQMLQQLDEAHYLDSEAFTAFYQGLVEDYRSRPFRLSSEAGSLGAGQNGAGATIAQMLGKCSVSLVGAPDRRLVGLIAPHLDYARGGVCYADAYATLASAGRAKRFVILGTNHFGRATSVVATGKDFQTALGTVRTDRDFLDALQARCGCDLCEHEFDHRREHSVELQVLILKHLLGEEDFAIVPLLCHDPCGPTGTAPLDGKGVDLRVFGEALGELIRADHTPTVVIAGADLSHVGWRFGDQHDLDDEFLSRVERQDHEVLAAVMAGQGEAFVDTLARRDNNTRVCSAGCIYALMTALPNSRAELLRYHQAVDQASGTGVTCSAVAFWES